MTAPRSTADAMGTDRDVTELRARAEQLARADADTPNDEERAAE